MILAILVMHVNFCIGSDWLPNVIYINGVCPRNFLIIQLQLAHTGYQCLLAAGSTTVNLRTVSISQ